MLDFIFGGRLPWLLLAATLTLSLLGGGYLYVTKLHLQSQLVEVRHELTQAQKERDEAAAIAVANAEVARELGEQVRRQLAAAQKRESLALARARSSQRLLAEARRTADAQQVAPRSIQAVVTKK